MIVVLGYYDKCNLGDEAYKIVFPKILEEYKLPIVFYNPYDLKELPENTKLVVCGGGDIIENWFKKPFDRLFNVANCPPVYAVSIGLTYASTLNDHYLGHFKKIWVRHQAYSSELCKLKKTANVEHIPDITFLLETTVCREVKNKNKIGVFLASGLTVVIEPLRKLLDQINQLFDITFYPFNTSPIQHENDEHFARKHFSKYKICGSHKVNTVAKMMAKMSKLHMAICVRYHSHIFSIIQNVPFVSIALTPKAQFLMSDFGYVQNVVTDVNQIDSALWYTIRNRHALIKKNKDVTALNRKILETVKVYTPPNLIEYGLALQSSGCAPEYIASSILYHITGSTQNCYTYGFLENLKNNLHSLENMINWLIGDFENKMKIQPQALQSKAICLVQKPEDFGDIHRSGWAYVVSALAAFHSESGILCDTYVDGTFLWKEKDNKRHGIIPYKKPWIGFIHHTQTTECGENNLQNLFSKESFQHSLRTCKLLITLSKYTKVWIEKNVPSHIKVCNIKHPTEFGIPFDLISYTRKPSVVQIGAWLRDPYAIYTAVIPWAKKFVLEGSNMKNYIHPDLDTFVIRDGSKCDPCKCDLHYKQCHIRNCYTCECYQYKKCGDDDDSSDSSSSSSSSDDESSSDDGCMSRPPHHHHHHHHHNICLLYILQWLWNLYAQKMPFCVCLSPKCRTSQRTTLLEEVVSANYRTVTKLPKMKNDNYDELLTKTVVFLKLEDASAVNTIIECIIRNTPIIVNRIPAVVEYLGNAYPLYYDHINQVQYITNTQIKAAYEYLKNMNKTDIMINSFTTNFQKILSTISF